MTFTLWQHTTNTIRVIRFLILLNVILFASDSLGNHTQSLLSGSLVDGLKSGQYFILMRHALAPGTGDPEEFKLSDCSTQRNLSPRGQHQAQQIGQRLRASGLDKASVFSSQWCRCLETAQQLDYGKIQALPAINSFFRDFSREKEQTRALNTWLKTLGSAQPHPVILVTHQVNITAITGIFPQSGEMIIIELDATNSVSVVAQFRTHV